ncbi:MAG: response regulator [Candidatus Aenigmatarchaeota archaeon]
MTYFVVAQFEWNLNNGVLDPLDKISMVVDDTEPEYWDGLLKLAGFQEIEGQPRYFRDGESALPALEKGRYDVILTDLELGEGKMDGIAFAQAARKVQLAKGKPAMIALFSYNGEKLKAAWVHGYHYPSSPGDLFFEQPDIINKSYFSPFRFRRKVECIYKNMK